MSVRLIPRDRGFYALFQEQAAIAAEAARVLEATIRDFDDPTAASSKLQELEHRGDDANHAVLRRLEATFVLPFVHNEIQSLTSRLDDIVDQTEKIGDMLVLYHVPAPPPGALDQATILVRACDVIVEAMGHLEKPGELRGFSDRLHALEKEADDVWGRNVRALFDDPTDAVAVLTGEEIYDGLEGVVDATDAVGRVLGVLASTPASPW